MAVGRDGQGAGLSGEVAIDVADGVVGQAGADGGAWARSRWRAGHRGGRRGAAAGQGDAGDRVAVDQAAGGELGAGESDGLAVGLGSQCWP